MVPSVTSAQRKLARGVEQVKALRREAGDLHEGNAYTFVVESERRSFYAFKFDCYAIEHRPPPTHWPLLLGEAVQNLRAALDHTIWRAWSDAGNTGDGSHTQFPIATDSFSFEVQAARMLEGVPDSIRTLVEAAQPYRVSPQAPTREALELLRTLSNTDKHRTLNTVATAIAHSMWHLPAGTRLSEHEFPGQKPLGRGKTHVASFVATSETAVEEMDVKPRFTYEVRIEGMPLDILVAITRRVFETVTAVETGQEPSPFAAYLI